VTGANSYRGIHTFIKTHRRRLNKAFKIGWKRPPAHTAIRYILQGLKPGDVEKIFREHAANLNSSEAPTGTRILALDGKALRGSFDAFNDAKARQILSAFVADTALVLAHIEIDEKSNEILAVQKLLEELYVAGHIVTLDAMHCQKKPSKLPPKPRAHLIVQFTADLFDHGTIERLAGHLETLLAGIVASPDSRLSELPLLSESERRQLLIEWNATATEYPRDRCVHELFAEQAARTPDAVAVICGGHSLTYAALNERANRLACHLKDLGVGPEARVALCADRSIEMVVVATLKAGGVYVPLDPAYPRERLSYMLQDSGAAVLLHAHLPAQMPLQLQEVGNTTIALVNLCADVAHWASRSGQNQDGGARSHNLAYLIYTSGSTGRPKGVMTPHRGAVNRLVAQGGFARDFGTVDAS
jgi:non-ribosomal peptide synthetase component F